MLIKSLMGYYPDVALGGLWMDPVLPESYGDLHITNAPMADGRIKIDISGSTVTIKGLPEGMLLHHGTRPWMADLVEQAGMRGKDFSQRLRQDLLDPHKTAAILPPQPEG